MILQIVDKLSDLGRRNGCRVTCKPVYSSDICLSGRARRVMYSNACMWVARAWDNVP